MDGGIFFQYLGALATQLPVFLVYLVGFILALVWRRRHPRVSVFLILALVILFLNAVVMTWVQLWFPQYWRTQGRPIANLNLFFMILGIARSLITAGGFVLLLLAVFTGRAVNAIPQPPSEHS